MTDRCISVWELLEEWGRWARSGDPLHLEPLEDAPIHIPLYDLYSPYRTAIEEGGEVPPLDAPQDPVDEPRAIATDRAVYSCHWRHQKIVKLHFWKLRRQDEDYVNAAVRAIADILQPVTLRRVA